MKHRKKLISNGCLKADREAFIQYLLDMGYENECLKKYKWITKCLDQFMYERALTKYSSDIGAAFLVEMSKSGHYTPGTLTLMRVVVRRFNCYMEHGEYIFMLPRSEKNIPLQFAEGLSNYLNHLRMLGLRASTIDNHRNSIQKTLLKFDAAEIQSISEIKPEAIYNAFEKTSDKQNFSSSLRCFLRYLYEMDVIEFDYSEVVPSVRNVCPIPSVYTMAETDALLSDADTGDNTKKRNDAAILLALRFGMRSCDIANLKISDIDFNRKTISFVQKKTQVPQYFDLLPDIEEALHSYICTARPVSDIPNVFLSINSPIRTITGKNVYYLISSRFKKSGVDTGERKRGGHSLRATLASELIAEKVPYDAVRKILGHEDPASTKHYVRFDIESLRSCSIEIPPVTGVLATYMSARLGGGAQ